MAFAFVTQLLKPVAYVERKAAAKKKNIDFEAIQRAFMKAKMYSERNEDNASYGGCIAT
ncbi:MAG: hypothetical protein R2778_16530 [Saprospiraceae bacterium]